MKPIFHVVPPPPSLERDIVCIRIAEYQEKETLKVSVCPSGFPGITFHYYNNKPVIKRITSPSQVTKEFSPLFLHGQITEVSVMLLSAPFSTIHVILKPHALRPLLSTDAYQLTDKMLSAEMFSATNLQLALLETHSSSKRITLLWKFLEQRLSVATLRDPLIEKCIAQIDDHIDDLSLEALLQTHGISERQFERRFRQSIGLTPRFFIRVRRANEAIRLIDSGKYERLSEVANALNYHDQSHFIKDMKSLAELRPTDIRQKVIELRHDQVGSSYTS